MKHDVTLYHRASKGGIKVWRCYVKGTDLVQEWGLQGCKIQENVGPQTSRGKEGTKAFKPAEQVVVEQFERKVKGKKEEGYVENIANVIDDVQAVRPAICDPEHYPEDAAPKSGLDFDNPPRQFAPAKPQNSIEVHTVQSWEKAGKLILQRKRDGMRHFIFFGNERIQIFSRRMENASGQFAALIAELEPFREILTGTVLDTEFIVPTKDDADDFSAVASICRSDDKKAQERLRYSSSAWHFMVFDILYVKGIPVFARPYNDRHSFLSAAVLPLEKATGKIAAVNNLNVTLTEAIEMAKVNKWEGLVAWEADKGTVVQMNGKPKRVNCAKIKPLLEDDFVATGYEFGQGSNSHVAGALFISQYNNGLLVPVGKVGTGLSQAQRGEVLDWKFPVVVQCEFAERTPDGSLRFPVFARKRTDKAPKECIWTPIEEEE